MQTKTKTKTEAVDYLQQFQDDPTLNMYMDLTAKTAIYPGTGTLVGAIYCSLKLAGESGEFAEKVGKAIRDDGEFLIIDDKNPRFVEFRRLAPKRREALIKELGDVLWYTAQLCKCLDTTLQEVAYKNLKKLAERHKTDTIHGDGDDR